MLYFFIGESWSLSKQIAGKLGLLVARTERLHEKDGATIREPHAMGGSIAVASELCKRGIKWP